MERRYFEIEELRAEENGDGVTEIKGKIPYNSKSLDLGGFEEMIEPGAFARSIREADQVALWSHDPSRPLGRKSRGTLVLDDRKTGLFFTIAPPDNSWGRDALVSVRRGDVNMASFGFSVPDEGDSWSERGGKILRRLLDVDLFELSPVVFGAYPQSQSNARDRYGDVPEIPADLRGATGSADSDSDRTRARASRQRAIQIATLRG